MDTGKGIDGEHGRCRDGKVRNRFCHPSEVAGMNANGDMITTKTDTNSCPL
jgi:hypothetical protein